MLAGKVFADVTMLRMLEMKGFFLVIKMGLKCRRSVLVRESEGMINDKLKRGKQCDHKDRDGLMQPSAKECHKELEEARNSPPSRDSKGI